MRKILTVILATVLMLITQPSLAADINQLEINKNNVVAFYTEAFNHLDFDAAAKYLGNQYIQHSTHVADGKEGLRAFIQMLRAKYPQTHVSIKKVFADGDYVILYVNFIMQNNTKGFATMDIFRLANGKIVEHWGVSEAIPENLANSNGVF